MAASASAASQAPLATPARPSADGLRDFDEMPGLRIPAIMQSLAFISSPMRLTRWSRQRYGPLFRLNSAVLGPMAYICDPKLAQDVFRGDPANLRAGVANQPLKPVAGAHSILLLDTDEHMRMRKLMLPPFHGEAIKRYGELMEEITNAEIDKMPVDQPFEMRKHTQAITLDVVLRAVFGFDGAAEQQELRGLLTRLLNFGPSVLFEFMRVDLGPRSPWGRYVRTKTRVDEILFAEMRKRRAAADAERDDVFSLLLAARDEDGNPLTDEELRDELLTLLLAGHETTATALAWATERLVRHPDKMAKLREDVQGGDGAYVEATIKETLRIRPVIMDVGRVITQEPFELGGYRIPVGVHLSPGIGQIHQSPDVYPQPYEFRPERFLDGAAEPYSWIPFGGGVRRCLGAAFAQYEMKIVLSAFARRLDLRPTTPKSERPRIRAITLNPANGAEVIATAKRAA